MVEGQWGEQGTDPAARHQRGCKAQGCSGRKKGMRGSELGSPGLPEKKWALKPFLETVLSDLNSTRMLLYWEVMTSGFSEPQNLPCSLESAVSPLRTSTKSYLHTCGAAQLQAHLLQEASPDHPRLRRLPVLWVLSPLVTCFATSNNSKSATPPHQFLLRSPHKPPALPLPTGFWTPRPSFPRATCSLAFKALLPEPPLLPLNPPDTHCLYIPGVFLSEGRKQAPG